MVIGESNPLAGQPIDVGSLVIAAAVTAYIGVAQIVGHNEDDVWPVCTGLGVGTGLGGHSSAEYC